MSLQSIFPTSLESGTELCDHHYFCCTGRKIEAKIWRRGYGVAEIITCKNLLGEPFGNISNRPYTKHVLLLTNKNLPSEVIRSMYVSIKAIVIIAKMIKQMSDKIGNWLNMLRCFYVKCH